MDPKKVGSSVALSWSSCHALHRMVPDPSASVHRVLPVLSASFRMQPLNGVHA